MGEYRLVLNVFRFPSGKTFHIAYRDVEEALLDAEACRESRDGVKGWEVLKAAHVVVIPLGGES